LNVAKADDSVMAIQGTIKIEGFSDDLLRIESDALADLDRVLRQQEIFLMKKSRVRWLVEGWIKITTSFTFCLNT